MGQNMIYKKNEIYYAKVKNMTVNTTFKFGEKFGEGELLAALRYACAMCARVKFINII